LLRYTHTHTHTHTHKSIYKSSQVTFIYIALFTIQIVSKQLHSDNLKVIQHRSIILLNIKYQKQAKSKATVAIRKYTPLYIYCVFFSIFCVYLKLDKSDIILISNLLFNS